MERTTEEVEELHTTEQIENEDDESDLDILLLLLENATRSTFIDRPVRRTISKAGYNYIQNALTDNPQHFRQLYRMDPDVFLKLCDVIRE